MRGEGTAPLPPPTPALGGGGVGAPLQATGLKGRRFKDEGRFFLFHEGGFFSGELDEFFGNLGGGEAHEAVFFFFLGEEVHAAVPAESAVDDGEVFVAVGEGEDGGAGFGEAVLVFLGPFFGFVRVDVRRQGDDLDFDSSFLEGRDEFDETGCFPGAQAGAGDDDFFSCREDVFFVDRPVGGAVEDGVWNIGCVCQVGFQGEADSFVGGQSFVVHFFQSRNVGVNVVEDDDVFFCPVVTVEAAGVLFYVSLPGDGHGQKKGVQSGVVEAFAYVFPDGHKDDGFIRGNSGHGGTDAVVLFPALASLEKKDVVGFVFEAAEEEGGVAFVLGHDQGCAAFFDAALCVFNNLLVPGGTFDDEVIEFGDGRFLGKCVGQAGESWVNEMADALFGGPVFGGVFVADGAELEEYAFVLTVASFWRGGEAVDVGGSDPVQHFFAGFGAGMVAFVHDDETIVFEEGEPIFPSQGGNHANVYDAGEGIPAGGEGAYSASSLPDAAGGGGVGRHFFFDFKKFGKVRFPVFQDFPVLDEDEGGCFPGGNEGGAGSSFAKGGGGVQNAGVVGEEGVYGVLLLGVEFPLEGKGNGAAGMSFIGKGVGDTAGFQGGNQGLQAASGKVYVFFCVIAPVHDARCAVGGVAHGVFLEKFGIAVGSQAAEAVLHAGL